MKTGKQLREERAPLAVTIRQMADKINKENRDFNAEEKPQWEKVNGDYNALSSADRNRRARRSCRRRPGPARRRSPGREDRSENPADAEEREERSQEEQRKGGITDGDPLDGPSGVVPLSGRARSRRASREGREGVRHQSPRPRAGRAAVPQGPAARWRKRVP
jgi:hypothetical protein